MYVCMYVCIYVCMYVCMYVCIYVYMYICIYVYMYICIYVYMYICMYVYMYICVYVYVYMYIHSYILHMLIHLFPATMAVLPSNNRPSRLEILAYVSVNIGDLAVLGLLQSGDQFLAIDPH